MSDKVINYVWDGTYAGEHNSARITWGKFIEPSLSDWSGTLFDCSDLG